MVWRMQGPCRDTRAARRQRINCLRAVIHQAPVSGYRSAPRTSDHRSRYRSQQCHQHPAFCRSLGVPAKWRAGQSRHLLHFLSHWANHLWAHDCPWHNAEENPVRQFVRQSVLIVISTGKLTAYKWYLSFYRVWERWWGRRLYTWLWIDTYMPHPNCILTSQYLPHAGATRSMWVQACAGWWVGFSAPS